MKQQFAVYRSRMIIRDPKTKTDAVFKSKREADLLCQEMNAHNSCFFVAPYYKPVKKKGIR